MREYIKLQHTTQVQATKLNTYNRLSTANTIYASMHRHALYLNSLLVPALYSAGHLSAYTVHGPSLNLFINALIMMCSINVTL